MRASPDIVVDGDQRGVNGLGVAKAADEVKVGCQDRLKAPYVVLIGVAVREGVDHCVRRARLVLNGEVEAEQLAHPMMPRNGGEALVEEVLQAVVVHLDDEAAPP